MPAIAEAGVLDGGRVMFKGDTDIAVNTDEPEDEANVRKNFPETWIWKDADGVTR